jgi:hypothetical protein
MLRLATGVFVAALAACACKSKPTTVAGGSGASGGTGGGTGDASECERVKPAVTALYEAEAKATGAAEKDATFVADNVAMVMKDCAQEPGRVAACAGAAASVAQLEKDCLIPLDPEGTEGDRLGK